VYFQWSKEEIRKEGCTKREEMEKKVVREKTPDNRRGMKKTRVRSQ
jgi:hypothetical protein